MGESNEIYRTNEERNEINDNLQIEQLHRKEISSTEQIQFSTQAHCKNCNLVDFAFCRFQHVSRTSTKIVN